MQQPYVNEDALHKIRDFFSNSHNIKSSKYFLPTILNKINNKQPPQIDSPSYKDVIIHKESFFRSNKIEYHNSLVNINLTKFYKLYNTNLLCMTTDRYQYIRFLKSIALFIEDSFNLNTLFKLLNSSYFVKYRRSVELLSFLKVKHNITTFDSLCEATKANSLSILIQYLIKFRPKRSNKDSLNFYYCHNKYINFAKDIFLKFLPEIPFQYIDTPKENYIIKLLDYKQYFQIIEHCKPCDKLEKDINYKALDHNNKNELFESFLLQIQKKYRNDNNHNDIFPIIEKDRWHDLSVTAIEKLIVNPYAIYAESILKLRKLPFNSCNISQFFGIMLHRILDTYYKDRGKQSFDNIIEDYLISSNTNLSHRILICEQLTKICNWVIRNDKINSHIQISSEMKFSKTFPEFNNITLSCRLDRIEYDDNNCIIIDYKSGSIPSIKDVLNSNKPQLLIYLYLVKYALLEQDVNNNLIISTQYWKLSYNLNNQKVKYDIKYPHELLEDIEQGLTSLIKKYQDPDNILLFYPDKRKKLTHDDYSHLARQVI
jgi:RecB family exonuclease